MDILSFGLLIMLWITASAYIRLTEKLHLTKMQLIEARAQLARTEAVLGRIAAQYNY